MIHIFVSYRRKDSKYTTDRIHSKLVERFRASNVFRDIDNVIAGSHFARRIHQAVEKCDVLLAVIGKEWNQDERLEDEHDFVRIEIESGLDRHVRVIPLLVDGASMPREEELPKSLRRLVHYQGLEIRSDPRF